MAESSQHRGLVQRLEKFAILMRSELPYLVIKLDLPGSEFMRPPKIMGFIPDLFAETLPNTITVVGEAKSEMDLEADHSRQQILGFLDYLRTQQRAVLVLSVPWTVAATTRAIVKNAKAALPGSEAVDFYVLDGITNEQSLVSTLCH